VQKAELAEQERARLAAAGANGEARAKAEADARAAEQAQLDTEKAKQVAQQQAAEAERNRLEMANAPAAPAVPVAAMPDQNVTVAALDPEPSQIEMTKSVQSELRRVGCYNGSADGDWGASSQRSLSQFNRSAGTKLDVKTVNADTLDAIKQKPLRVCPLVCDHGFKADGDHCTRIVCAEGYFVNADNECEKERGKATVKRDDAERASRRARQDRQDRPHPQSRQYSAGRGGPHYDAGYGALPPKQGGRPLTGDEREFGCNTNQAIMSGRCP
jgi:hypothetical protein